MWWCTILEVFGNTTSCTYRLIYRLINLKHSHHTHNFPFSPRSSISYWQNFPFSYPFFLQTSFHLPPSYKLSDLRQTLPRQRKWGEPRLNFVCKQRAVLSQWIDSADSCHVMAAADDGKWQWHDPRASTINFHMTKTKQNKKSPHASVLALPSNTDRKIL